MDTLTQFQQKFDLGCVEMSKKCLSNFYMLQILEGEPLPSLPYYTFGGPACFFHHVLPEMAEASAREITLTTLEQLFSRVFAHVFIQRTSLMLKCKNDSTDCICRASLQCKCACVLSHEKLSSA